MGLKELFGKISDAIPNEFSKLNSYSKFLNLIPGLGQALAMTSQGISGLDRFGETYSNGGDFGESLGYGVSSFQGGSGDPNMYSPKNNQFSGDEWMTAGRIGDLLPSSGGINAQPYMNALQYNDVFGKRNLTEILPRITMGNTFDGMFMPRMRANIIRG